MPLAIWIVGFGIFAQGTSELMLAGLLPDMAADLHVTIPQAGWLISAFALGMLLGAPVLAILTLRWPRRRALLIFLSVFVLSHLICALTDSYALLLAMRFLGAFTYAGFWAVGGSIAIALARPGRRGQAMSIVAGGLTIATVIGLPMGTWIGQHEEALARVKVEQRAKRKKLRKPPVIRRGGQTVPYKGVRPHLDRADRLVGTLRPAPARHRTHGQADRRFPHCPGRQQHLRQATRRRTRGSTCRAARSPD